MRIPFDFKLEVEVNLVYIILNKKKQVFWNESKERH